MADNGSRSISPWWSLLILPLAGGVGWAVGQAPAPSPAPAASPYGVAAAPASGAAEVSRWTSMNGALAESQRTGKPILIDFNADWCGPCQMLKREVFENEEHGRAVQTAVIPVSIVDRRRENGSNSSDVDDLQNKYGVDAFPTLIVFSPRTGKSKKSQGFGGAERTVAWITNAASSVR